MTRTFATLTLLGLAGAVAAAPPTAPQPRVARAAKPAEIKINDAQEIVVYAPQRPIRVRLGVRYEGKTVAEMWRAKLKAAFDYFDRDKDGGLNDTEVKNVFSDTGLSLMLQNGIYQPTPQDRPSLDRLDTDGNREVSFDEFVASYKASTALILRPQPAQAENPANAAATEALFKLMDANGDGKLTRDEVKAIEAFVATRDSDEDECLNLAELIPNQNVDPRLRGQVAVARLNRPNPAPNPQAAQTVVTYEAGRVPGTLTQQVIKKYDKDGDFELTREECAFDEPTFSRLDVDGNGRLDGEELDVWRTGPADLEVSLSLSSRPADCVAKLLTDARDAEARGFTVKQVEPARLIVRTGRQPIDFWANGSALNGQPVLKQQYLYLFQQAAGQKGYILDKDLTGQNAVQFQFIRTVFGAADADADGKMTRAEFDGYFDLQDSFRNVALTVTPAIQTPTLFQLLDENRDGRLGVRELRTAWDRLIALEPGDAEVVTKAAIQPSVSLRLSRGIDRFVGNEFAVQVVDFNGRAMNQVPVPQKGPMWFRKMDRNADGDVSRSEYLGTRAEFDTIDADRDNLISLQEAEAWDKQVRK